jgi:hypothetical protein
MKNKPEQSNMVKEAGLLLAVAKLLEPLTKEQQCAIMAQVSARFGFYTEAHQFLRMADAYRNEAK